MRRPLLSVIIPTIGRPGLRSALQSVLLQPQARQVEVIVVGDSFERPTALEAASALCAELGARYLEHDGGLHCWGQPQRNAGMAAAKGRWLAFLADDDIHYPDSLTTIFAAIDQRLEPMPLLFRVDHWIGLPIWQAPYLKQANIDANCLVVPNRPDRLGTWTNRYEGDFDFAAETVAKWRGQVEWRREFLGIGRPAPERNWTLAFEREEVAV
jgi:glycosyltransferase involved in cell wall biosynthesis